jgi:hypothetical protein
MGTTMSFSIPCPSCARDIAPDVGGRFPPWCRACGASYQARPEPPPAPALPPRPAGAIAPEPVPPRPTPTGASGLAPPFFHACEPSLGGSHSLFRVYVTDCDLLVFKLGEGAVSGGQIVPRSRRRFFPGGAVAAIREHQEREQQRLVERIRHLDQADEAALRDEASLDHHCFVAGPDEVRNVCLDPPSFWYRWLYGTEYEAVLRFHHLRQGKVALALPSVADARRAMEEMPRVFGDRLEVKLAWGPARRAPQV